RKQARDRRLERVQARERVLAHADQHVDAKATALEHPRELLRELAAALVVQEQFLELVEDHIQVAAGAVGGVGERVGKVPSRAAGRLDERRYGIARPRRENDHFRLSLLPQPVRDACAHDRGLADTAWSVEYGDSRGDQVGGDDLALALASEEEQRVAVGVLERRQALVRRRGSD